MDSSGEKLRLLRNLNREKIFKPHAEAVFAEHLGGMTEFEIFYFGLKDEDKDLFLGIATKYVLLVKCGDWHVNLEDCDPVIDYLTNSFKLVSLFSLIESLSLETHEDFHGWLRKQEGIFPILEKAKLESLYERYKETYGSIRRFVRFFERLPLTRQVQLRSGFKVRGAPICDIKAVAKFLYDLRSKFVHEGEFVLEIASMPVMSCHRNKETLTDISIPTLLCIFEEGVLAYFRRES
jgi:hypothetical protein